MLNQIVMVGRLTSDPQIKEVEEGKKISYITLAIPRSYKNKEGLYDTDFISATLYDGIATNTAEYCHKGDIVGIKGRLQNSVVADEDGNVVGKAIEVIAEKVTFLSSNSGKEEG